MALKLEKAGVKSVGMLRYLAQTIKNVDGKVDPPYELRDVGLQPFQIRGLYNWACSLQPPQQCDAALQQLAKHMESLGFVKTNDPILQARQSTPQSHAAIAAADKAQWDKICSTSELPWIEPEIFKTVLPDATTQYLQCLFSGEETNILHEERIVLHQAEKNLPPALVPPTITLPPDDASEEEIQVFIDVVFATCVADQPNVYVHDIHTIKTLGKKRPDIAVLSEQSSIVMLPMQTNKLAEIKTNGEFGTPGHKLQAYHYGQLMLEANPTLRKVSIALLSHLQVMFMTVTKDKFSLSPSFKLGFDEQSPTDGMIGLYNFLIEEIVATFDMKFVDATTGTLIELNNDGVQLAAARNSAVFGVGNQVVKRVHSKTAFDLELEVLETLCKKNGHANVLKLVGVSFVSQSLLLAPRGLATLQEYARKNPGAVYKLNFKGLKAGLDHIHEMGYVSRDVRPDNIVVGMSDGGGPTQDLIHIDLGLAVPIDYTHEGFSGVLAFAATEHLAIASNKVIDDYEWNEETDLESFAKTVVYVMSVAWSGPVDDAERNPDDVTKCNALLKAWKWNKNKTARVLDAVQNGIDNWRPL